MDGAAERPNSPAPEAAARNERRLEAVRYSAVFGADSGTASGITHQCHQTDEDSVCKLSPVALSACRGTRRRELLTQDSLKHLAVVVLR
jgi:hypothetical protein